jgi:hypothetical protein
MRKSVLATGMILAACGGAQTGSAPVSPMGSPAQALAAFMQAAADSNLTRMSELWGSSKGSAAATRIPADYEKRIILLQAYLHADSSKIVSNTPVVADENRRQLVVAIYRSGCMKQVPATMLRLGTSNWIVLNIDVASAGNPARPCEQTD